MTHPSRTRSVLLRFTKHSGNAETPPRDLVETYTTICFENFLIQVSKESFRFSTNPGYQDGYHRPGRGRSLFPFLKKGKPSYAPSSYGPISLTSILCKLLERVVSGRLSWFLESRNLHSAPSLWALAAVLAGFRTRPITTVAITAVCRSLTHSANLHAKNER